jgi:hypothetical protein
MSWKAPGRAIGISIHEEDSGVHQYTRGEDDSGEAIWVSDAASITTAELLDALTVSLQAPYVAPDVANDV